MRATLFRVLFLILVVFSAAVLAQEVQEKQTAVKFDEFGPITECDFSNRLDQLFVSLIEKPQAKGYIITYKGLNFLPAQYDAQSPTQRRILNAIMFRRFDKSRIEIIDGGFRKEMSNELWIVPQGAENPVPTQTVSKPNIPTDRTFLYDTRGWWQAYEGVEPYEFLLPKLKAEIDKQNKELEAEFSETSTQETGIEKPTKEELEEERFFWVNENFGRFIKQLKNSKGLIIFYADKRRLDVKEVGKHIEEGRKRIAESSGVLPDRIQIIFGGYREYLQADFWVITENGKIPKPSPAKRG